MGMGTELDTNLGTNIRKLYSLEELENIESTLATIGTLSLFVDRLGEDHSIIESNYLKLKMLIDLKTKENNDQIKKLNQEKRK